MGINTKIRVNLIPLFLVFAFAFTEYADLEIEWATPMTHDFGDISREVPVFHEFIFKNTGRVPVVLSNVRPSCGCTATYWQETPVMPDSISTIAIEFDARDEGYFKKMIKVYFQGQRKGYKLYIEGYVEE